MPTLEQIEEEIQTIIDTFGDVEPGEAHANYESLSEEMKKALEDYLKERFGERAEKVDSIAQFFRMTEIRIAARREEAKRLERKAKTDENTLNFLKVKYLAIMESHGKTKLEGNAYDIKRTVSKCCVIEDMDKLPEEWIRVKTERSPMKREILAELKKGTVIPGARIGENVSIKVA